MIEVCVYILSGLLSTDAQQNINETFLTKKTFSMKEKKKKKIIGIFILSIRIYRIRYTKVYFTRKFVIFICKLYEMI